MRSIFAKSKYLILVICSLLLSETAYADVSANGTSGQNVLFTDVAGEYYHFLALDDKGNVWGWGNNIANQLGNAAESYRTIPVRIKGFENVKLIAAGYDHSTVVKQDGTVWVWGDNDQDDSEPRQVKGISDIIAIADSAYYTLALRKDGTIWGWGKNDVGQLGIGRTSDHEATPVQVQTLSNVAAIHASFDEGFAVTSDGKVWRWGAVFTCSGSTCTKGSATSPILFEGLDNVKSISDEIAVLQNGTVIKWGINFQGSLGLGTMESGYLSKPTQLPSLTDIVAVSKTRALTKDGQVWSWGRNEYGQVGDGTTDSHPKPILLSGINNVADMTSGEEITVALTRDGKLYEWGDNRNGEISNTATTFMPPTPVPMTKPIVTYVLPIPRKPNSWTYSWTFLDDKGSVIKDNQIYYRTKPFSEGLAAVHLASNNQWTFINVHGEPAFAEKFTIVRDFHQGMAAVKDQDGWHFINTKGDFINRDRYQNADSFANGLAPVLVGNKWGYIGLSGKLQITPQFASAKSFANGLAAVQVNGKWGFIDTTGKFVIKPAYSDVGSFAGQAAAAKQNGKWGYIHKTGNWAIKPQYEEAKTFSSANLAPVKRSGKWGYINLAGKLVITPQYEDATPFQEGLAGVKKNGLWAIINSKGNPLTPFQFVEVQPYNNKFAWVVTATDNGYLDASGNWYYKDKIQN